MLRSKWGTVIAVLFALVIFNAYLALSLLTLRNDPSVSGMPSWLLLPMFHLFATRETALVWVGQLWPFGNAALVLVLLLRLRTRKGSSRG